MLLIMKSAFFGFCIYFHFHSVQFDFEWSTDKSNEIDVLNGMEESSMENKRNVHDELD